MMLELSLILMLEESGGCICPLLLNMSAPLFIVSLVVLKFCISSKFVATFQCHSLCVLQSTMWFQSFFQYCNLEKILEIKLEAVLDLYVYNFATNASYVSHSYWWIKFLCSSSFSQVIFLKFLYQTLIVHYATMCEYWKS